MAAQTRPGASARRHFHELRLANIKRDWRLLSGLGVVAVIALWMIAQQGPLGLALGGSMLGFIAALLMVGWMIGFNVRTLPWLWGAWGEEQTGEELAKLDPRWHVTHDVPSQYGNWDHIAIGPGGVFMIDSKRLTGPVKLDNDCLSAGRTRFEGKTFRGGSFGLREALQQTVPDCPWVQAVVAVWGDFPDAVREHKRVVYVAGGRLTAWLQEQPPRLDHRRLEKVVEGVRHLGTPGDG